MDCEATVHDLLERMLRDADAHFEPTQLPLSLLKAITNNFSDGHQIGSGGFAVVYKGLLPNGTSVAVKKLSQTFEVDEKKFCQELASLMRVKHKNIVRFLGYCADTQGKVCKWEGKNVMAEERQRLLCFEFMPKGSLDKYIKDMTQGLDWRTIYKIIKGICEGLHYLHENKIVHLDLKPANILLDDYMVPKIADFGISRCFDEKQTRAATSKVYGTLGYMAPEFYNEEITITFKSDIYSLGTIIIEMLTRRKGYPDIDNVLTSWSTRFENVPGDPRLEHVKACVEMGIKCIDINPQRRPITQHIIGMLVDMEHTYGFDETDSCTSSAAHVSLPMAHARRPASPSPSPSPKRLSPASSLSRETLAKASEEENYAKAKLRSPYSSSSISASPPEPPPPPPPFLVHGYHPATERRSATAKSFKEELQHHSIRGRGEDHFSAHNSSNYSPPKPRGSFDGGSSSSVPVGKSVRTFSAREPAVFQDQSQELPDDAGDGREVRDVHGSEELYGYRAYQSIPMFDCERSGSDPILDDDEVDKRAAEFITRFWEQKRIESTKESAWQSRPEVDEEVEEFIAWFREQNRR